MGADGWMLVTPTHDADAEAAIQLYNSDGSTAEISGNGTRCAAALLVRHNLAPGVVRIRTGAASNLAPAGPLQPGISVRDETWAAPRSATRATSFRSLPVLAKPPSSGWAIRNCVLAVKDFEFDWRSLGAEIESHPDFPDRTNVSFVKRLDEHTIDVRFFERGAGETMSSGTGSTGAAVAAVTSGTVEWPVCVRTPAGPLEGRCEEDIYLTGPARIVCEGEFFV